MAKRKIYPMFIPHAGCPNQCVFCNQKHISGSLFPVSGKDVHNALSALEGEDYELAFYGGSFTAIPEEQQEELLRSVQPFLRSGLVSSVRVSTRPDAIDAPCLDRLRRYGVETVELGAQSMTDCVLQLSARGHTAEDVRRAAAMVKNAGFTLILQMMTGLPGETRESTARSAREIIALRPDGVRLYPTVIVRDTPLYELWKRGEYAEHTVEDAVEVCADILPLFMEAGISVIRLGLNPTEELSGGEAVGGAYHPALGELVRSRIYRRKAEALLEFTEPGSSVVLEVARGHLSQVNGQKRCNLEYLREKYALREIYTRETVAGESENFFLTVAKC